MDETKRPVFWRWGDPVTVRNPIREKWEASQARLKAERDAKRVAYFLKHGCWPKEGQS